MSDLHIRNVIEAALLAAGRPLGVAELCDLFDEFERPTPETVRATLTALTAEYTGRGIELREVASGFRVEVRGAVAARVSRLWQERPARYSRAMLETLALIAYRQPATRGEIEDIRGVAVNPNIVRTLAERNWIRIVGHRETPGRPELLATTREFLDYFGLKSLDELPSLAQLRDLETLGVQLDFDAPVTGAGEAAETTEAEAEGESAGVAGARGPRDAAAEGAEAPVGVAAAALAD